MRALLLLLGVAGCFDPTFRSELACDQGRCPPGYRCGDDDVCRRTVGSISDASPPDAAPVTCDGDEDCTDPADPCLVAGPCEEGTCRFAEMDCSSLDGECTAGVCQEGECVAKPVRETLACGDGKVCGGFGACAYADTCDESGTRTRSCTDSTCQAGACEVGAPYDDTVGCNRDTDGVECMPSTVTGCAACGYTTTCDNDAPAVSCTCTDYDCAAGTCVPSSTTCSQDICQRETEGMSCSPPLGGCCSPSGNCLDQCV